MITLIPHHFMVSSLWSPALNKPKWFWPQARSPCYHHCCRASSWPHSDPSIPCGKLPRTHLLNSIKTQVTCETNLIHMGSETGVHPQVPWKMGKMMINHQDVGTWPRTTRTTNQVHHYHHYGIYLIFGCTKMPLAARFTTKSIGSEFLARIARAPKKILLGGSQKLVNWNTSWNTKNHSWLVVEPSTPLKNDGVRQLGLLFTSIPNIWKNKNHLLGNLQKTNSQRMQWRHVENAPSLSCPSTVCVLLAFFLCGAFRKFRS